MKDTRKPASSTSGRASKGGRNVVRLSEPENFEFPKPGSVTSANAQYKLAEQLAAVVKLNDAIRTGALASEAPPDALTASLPDKLRHWLDQLLQNMKKIAAHLPEAESSAVSAGLPTGVTVTVTFTAHAENASSL
jgi:hypothetical protein